jgi:hypothetical protein
VFLIRKSDPLWFLDGDHSVGTGGTLEGCAMKLKLIIVALATFAFAQQSHAADSDFVCSGILLDQPRAGVSLGLCDLNWLTEKEYKLVKSTCGEPNEPDDDHNKTVCYIRVGGIKQKKNIPAITVVTKLLGVAAERP